MFGMHLLCLFFSLWADALGFIMTDDQQIASSAPPVFSKNMVPKVLLCEVNKQCSFVLPIDGKQTQIPNVQDGHRDPGLKVETIGVWIKQPFICTSDKNRCPYEAMVTVIPTEEKKYQYCVQTTDEYKVNADELCFMVQGVTGNLMSATQHFNYPPTFPNNSTVSCPKNVTCHYSIEIGRHGGYCMPPRVHILSDVRIRVNETEVKQSACRYDVAYTPSVNALGNKTVCVSINTPTVETHCVNVEVTSQSRQELAGPCSRIYCTRGSFCDSVDGKPRCMCQPGFTGANCANPVQCYLSFPKSVTCAEKNCHVTGITIGTKQFISDGNIVRLQQDANNGKVIIINIETSGNAPEICYKVNQTNCYKEGCISMIPDKQLPSPTHMPGGFSNNNLTYNCNTGDDCYLTITTYPTNNNTCPNVTVHPNTTVNNHRIFRPSTFSGTQCTTTALVTGISKTGDRQQLCLQTRSDVKCIDLTVKDFEKCSTNPCKNGGSCEALVTGYSCTCKLGWTGTNCRTNINECSPDPCQNGICHDGVNNYTCTCHAGYTGRKCETDINECSSDPCLHGSCRDDINSYKCTCDAGYTGRNCGIDIIECNPDPCQHGICHDGINNFTCTCFAGYTGRNCETGINECNSDPCQHGACHDGVNNYTCTCHAGFTGQNCEIDINECSPNPCNNGTCLDGVNNYTCTCHVGYTGQQCETDIDECSLDQCVNGTCVDGINTYTCKCDPGFNGRVCGTNIDECSSNPCVNGTCIDGINKYTCVCEAGFSGRICDTNIDECSLDPCVNGTCVDGINNYTCICDPGFSGRACGKNINECSSNPCVNGTCIDGINNYTCACDAGFSGRICGTNIDECSIDPCVNGTCVDGINNYTCICHPGFSGRVCGTNINECSSNPCVNGTCIDGINNCTCVCEAGFTGRICDTNIDECSLDPCAHGTCVDGINNYTCICDSGFSGLVCGTNIDECSPNPCVNGTCIDGINNYTCVCEAGFSDRICDTNIDECSLNPCVNGSCVDGINNYTCICDPGFSGHTCGTNIDECSPAPCVHGTCMDGINNYTCVCDDGFSGRDCGTDIGKCRSNPCQNRGICYDGINSYACKCDGGYTGQNCETEINECLSGPCLNGAACSDLVNGFNCSCKAGFSGLFCENRTLHCLPGECLNGGTCVDGNCQCQPGYTGEQCEIYIDPCQSSPCLQGDCYHHNTDFYCECQTGYTGKRCETLINTCDPNPCVNGGLCINAINSFTCSCRPGFTGYRCQTDIDDCLSQPCMHAGKCKDNVHSFTCQCQYGYGGDRCETVTNLCLLKPCVTGKCFSRASDYHCTCPTGYVGKTCNTTVMVVNGPDRVNLTVHGGGDILMNCNVTGQPASYSWAKKNGCQGVYEAAKGPKLQIHNAERGDAGIYTCTASNGKDRNVTRTFALTVNKSSSDKCVFDRNATCDWKQLNSTVDDKFDWTRLTGSTQSSGTGPDNDHTVGNDKGVYMYIEASSPRLQGDYASFMSQVLPANHSMCLEFWYYMYGDGIGNLTVNLKDSCLDKETQVFKRTGDQGQKWIKASVTIPSHSAPNDYTIVLTGDIGPTYHGDTAIDDLSVSEGNCAGSAKESFCINVDTNDTNGLSDTSLFIIHIMNILSLN